ncbi:PDDEXK family nuclease [Aeromicrobium terrae]|uniref:DUF559 domain-containing protein n=1 Tax=Aeromicrobium terrae TaxID=2498846 RepID=A0A5C8NCP2_9ACTN|nr:hypothetical protein [Aeromicrobium terrae]TXL57262.1 hypothetical protein FHP06_14550 [Aeromicrobium terrae]
MSRHPFIPQELRGRPFTTAEADAAGLTASMRRGRHVEQVHRGVWSLADTPRTFEFQVHAARMALARDAVLSHVSALRWLGVEVGRETPIHFSTNRPRQTREDIVLHRRIGTISPRLIRGIDTLGPDRSFVDSATILGIRQLVRAGDALVRAGLTTVDDLVHYVTRSHLDGVVRARQAAALVRARVDSLRETDLRLLIVLAGLPEPEVNVDVHADDGTWLARGDLVLPELRVVIEHDGWVHERDAEQRQKDHFRRERIEAAGWTLIVVTVADFQHPISVVTRIFEALRRRGYDGPPPELTRTWRLCARNL